jgi:GT2 family glycosyltransferase
MMTSNSQLPGSKNMGPLTIGITTRDRPESLRRCLASIAQVLGRAHDVIVFDDGSTTLAVEQIAGYENGLEVRILRADRSVGLIVGRNEMMREARHEMVLLLDDDTVLVQASAVDAATTVLHNDPRVAAVAFAQAEPDGRPWPEPMQPGPGQTALYVPAFIGFAHLLRRSVFLALGGYRGSFVFCGEEKDYGLRLLAAGFDVVYLPAALIAHLPDPHGRDQRRYVRYTIRNDCLSALYNVPWPVAAFDVPRRLWRFRQMARSVPGGDPDGLRWILGELRRALPGLRTLRRPVSWSALRRWRALRRAPHVYAGGRPHA